MQAAGSRARSSIAPPLTPQLTSSMGTSASLRFRSANCSLILGFSARNFSSSTFSLASRCSCSRATEGGQRGQGKGQGRAGQGRAGRGCAHQAEQIPPGQALPALGTCFTCCSALPCLPACQHTSPLAAPWPRAHPTRRSSMRSSIWSHTLSASRSSSSYTPVAPSTPASFPRKASNLVSSAAASPPLSCRQQTAQQSAHTGVCLGGRGREAVGWRVEGTATRVAAAAATAAATRQPWLPNGLQTSSLLAGPIQASPPSCHTRLVGLHVGGRHRGANV